MDSLGLEQSEAPAITTSATLKKWVVNINLHRILMYAKGSLIEIHDHLP